MLLATLSLLLFLGIYLWAPLPQANSQSSVVSPEVHNRVLRDGRARVIAELRLPGAYLPEGLLAPAARSVQRGDIASARLQVLGRLAGRNHTVLHQYSTVPFVALDVGPDALTELDAGSIWVKRVVLDTLNAPNLPQSVPLIGADQAWSRGYDGTGVMVAIIDTGVEVTHPFLAGKVVEEACYSSTVAGHSVTMCPNGSAQQTGPGAGVSCPLSVCWHGTHVAGIAAGNGAGAGVGFSGVAKGAQIMSVMVFSKFTNSTDCGGSAPCALAWTSDTIAGLERVYTLSGIRNFSSANLSLGDGSANTVACDGDPTKPIIDNLRSVGIATAVAAGNDGFTNALSAPACISSAVSVGATTKSDVITSYSNIASFLSLLAPGGGLGNPPVPIYSSVTGGAFGYASGTSMATPHVTGAWAVLRQAAPSASVDQILTALQSTGVPISETSGGVTITKPRIRVNLALGALVPAVSTVTPNQGAQGASVPVTITGTGFIAGATVSVSATGVAASNVTVASATQITATLTIASNATTGARDMTVTNPGGGRGTLTGGFTVTGTGAGGAATLTLAYDGMLRDRVGQNVTALGPDGALDGTLTATLQATGGRTITALRLDSSGPGTWDTSGTRFFVLGVATSLDGPLLNAPGTMAVNFPVANGGSFVVFAADYLNMEFLSGRTLTLTATFSDGSTAVASTTVTASAATLTLAYNGMLRDRVGQGVTALGPDGALDGTLTATLQATGGRTITALRLDSSGPGTWDTSGTRFFVLGVATALDGPLLNAPGTMAVNFPVANGGSFAVFAADYLNMEFLAGRTLTLTVTFSDGSTAVASTTVTASAATLTLAYNGMLRDRVGQGVTALGPDGALDGTLTATLQATGGRTITALRLDSSGPGTWDTSATRFFVLGVATALDGPLLNAPGTMAVNFPVANGGSFAVFAADYLNMEFLAGRTLTLTATFSDGSTAVAATVAP